MFQQISKQLSDFTVVTFEDLREFRDFERIPFFDTVAPDVFSLFLIWSREYPDVYSEDAFMLGAVTQSNLIRKSVYEDLEKKTAEKKLIVFLKLQNNDKILIHAVGKNPKQSKKNHYEVEFHEWTKLTKINASCRYWIRASNEKQVADALTKMLGDEKIWLDDLHRHVSDITPKKLGLVLRSLNIATRRVYDTTTKRLRRKIVTPKTMLKTAIERYQLS